jgi:hypothetical protein
MPNTGDWTTISRGGPITINTPDSSTGQPFRQAPSASTYQPSFAQPQGGQLTTTTPNSRTGAPAPGIRTVPSLGGRVGVGVGGLPGLISAFPTPSAGETEQRLNNPPLADDPWLLKTFGSLFGGSPQAAPVTQSGPGRSPSGPAPPGGPPYRPEDDLRPPPIPPSTNFPPLTASPQGPNVPYPPPRPKTGGGGGRGQAPGRAPPMMNLQPQPQPQGPAPGWTSIDRPNADVAGGRSVAGQLAPQYFTPAREPGGPAQMGVFDFSTLFNHPAVAQAAAAHPAVQAAARAPVPGPLAPGALSRARAQAPAQAPGPMDPSIIARQNMAGPGPMDPSIIARQKMRGGGRLAYTPEDMAYQ